MAELNSYADSVAEGEKPFHPSELFKQVENLETEVQSLTEQVARDFEELALLQSLAGSLELKTETPEPIALVLDFLPRLPVSIMCEAVALIPNAEVFADFAPATCKPPALWSGEPVVDDKVCNDIVDKFAERAASYPVVVNDPREHGIDERVDSLILVEIKHGGREGGWLMAVNHVVPTGPVPYWVQEGFTTVEANLMLTAASILATQLHNMRLLRQKEQLFTDVVRAMVNAVEARDPYTCGHSERVAMFGKALGQQAGLSNAESENVYLTGLLHDVGKIAIPDAVLQKPGALDPVERDVIETHTDAGWRILHPLSQLGEVLPGVLYHHEKYDGSGYPDGLKGKDIPRDGRILAICDAYDAMTSDRPYRKGMDQSKAEAILKGGAGTHWDPEMIEHFFAAMPRIVKIRETYRPREAAEREGSRSADGQAD